jgi:hypothetical protein
MKRKHYDLIIAWANGAEIEYFDTNEWRYLSSPGFYEYKEYRIKPKPININGFDVPEPLYEKPVDNATVYFPSLLNGVISVSSYIKDPAYQNLYEKGLIFKEREDCEKYLEAILSFTKKS